jgi:hypothetical protein
MEPLTAFFYLEGLTFGIIGTILVINGILSKINLIEDSEMDKITTNLKNQMKEFPKMIDEGEAFLKLNMIWRHKLGENIRSIQDDSLISQSILNKKFNYDLQLLATESLQMWTIVCQLSIDQSLLRLKNINNLKTHTFNKNRVRMGAPCLIGGFIFHGIGILTQL